MIQSCKQCLDCFWRRQVGEVLNWFYTVFSSDDLAVGVRASVVHLCCDKYLLSLLVVVAYCFI